MGVDVIIEDPRWESVGLEALAETVWRGVVAALSLPEECDVAVLGCGNARIAELNAEFRGKPTPTNVLSWPSVDRGSGQAGVSPDIPKRAEELGDIAIAYETTVREAESGGIPLENHVIHLLVHGTLHLLGYDHENDADGDLMESVETVILANLGVQDPYSLRE